MDDYPLFGNIDVIIEAHASGTGAVPPQSYAFTRCITKKLLRRTHDRVLELISNGTLPRGTLLVTMSRVILGIVGVRPPTEHWALDKIGNRLRKILHNQYLEPRTKLMRHKARNKARLQALDDEVIEIPWVGLAQTSGSPVVVPDTVPKHARDSRSYATPLELQQIIIAHEETDAARQHELRRSAQAEVEAARRAAEAEAEAVRSIFATEEARLAKEAKEQAKAHKAIVKELEAKSHRLEGHVGRRQQEAVKEHARYQQEAKRATLAEELLKQQASAAKEEAKLFQAKMRTLQAEKLKLQGQVARAWHDAEAEHERCERVIVVLEKKVHHTETEAAALMAEKEHMRLLKNQQAARARQLERAAADKAETSKKRLSKLQDTQGQADELRHEIEQLKEELLHQQKRASEKQEPKVARRDEDGRFRVDPWQHRVLEWAQLARGVAPSTVNRNISEVLTLFASDQVVPLACAQQMRKLRSEVTIAGEMIAALRVALCVRIISFGFDESTKFGLGLLSTNTQIEPHDAPGTSVDVVMRGVTLTAGGTAEAISKDIEHKLFTHARRLLSLWKEEHEQMYGTGSWAKASMPLPDNIGLHRLSENAVLMSDTCNAARATKRLLAEMAETAGMERLGTEVWEKLSEAEREVKVKCHLGDCHDHLRNIIIKAMAEKATEYMKGHLGDSLDDFSSFDRMSVDPMDSIRAACKELHPDGEYAKGKGRESEATRKRDHPSDLWLPIFNGVGNSRMDAVFDGAVPLYMNRRIILEFIHPLVHGPASNDNLLEKFLWRVLESTEMVGLLRVCTLWQTLVTEPLRWLSGKSSALDDWSMVNSNKLLDITYDLMVAVAAAGSVLLDSTLDPFAAVAASQPKFAAHRTAQQQQTIKAPDGTPHLVHACTLAEARNPSTPGGKETTLITIELAQRMANAALVAMRDTKRAIADKLSSQQGVNAASAAKSVRVHEATKGAHVNNGRVESHFGKTDNLMRMFRGSTTEAYAGMVQQAYNHDFDMPLNVASDRRKRKAETPDPPPRGGFFWSSPLMTDELRASLVSVVRKEAEHARSEGRKALVEHDAAKLARREERLITALNAAVDYYAFGHELFESWTTQGATDAKTIDAQLAGKPETQQLEYLRHQIDMRVIGLGWNQFKTKWSAKSDPTIGTVSHLRALLVDDILPHEHAERRLKRLPLEAAPPHFTAKDLGQLGTANADALAIKSKALFSTAELKVKAEAEVKRREEAGISDSVERLQPATPPPFDQQLVGKRIEVLWKYFNKDTNEPMLIWATGRVTRVADGLTDTKSARAKKLLPAGAVLWAWDADPDFGEVAGEQWLTLLPKRWNPPHQVVYGWRYDPRELSAAAPERDQRRRNATRMEE